LLSFPLVLIIICFPKKRRDVLMFRFLRIISTIWLYACFIFPKTYGKHYLNTTATQVIIANHASYLDAPALYTSIRNLFKTLGKEEMARIPLFKYIYTSAVITVNRGSTMARAKSFIQMQDELKDGKNVVFFPEGTFDENQNNLKTFFDGAFHLAIKTQTAITPLLLIDTHLRMQPNTVLGFTPGKSRTVFLPSIITKGLTLAHTDVLKRYCYHSMNTILQYCKVNDASTYDAFIKNYYAKNPFVIS
jgi:1-acyl-sn-glycerol-3-phosphate acyltransferase